MKVIHSRWYIKNRKEIDALTLLSWYASIIMWHKLGYSLKMYADIPTLEIMKKYFLDELYDEIDTTLLENEKTIDRELFWAMPKILSYKKETKEGNDVIVSDTDIIPFIDFKDWFNTYDLVVWSQKEYFGKGSIYLPKEQISTAPNYKYPKWFSWNARPFNTGIIYFKYEKDKKLFIESTFDFIKDFVNNKDNNCLHTMCHVEQRFIAEIAKVNGLKVGTIQQMSDGSLNRNGFHAYIYKNIADNYMLDIYLLNLIKENNQSLYERISNLSIFNDLIEKAKTVYLIDINNYIKWLMLAGSV